MALVTYVDDNALLGMAYVKKDNSIVQKVIGEQKAGYAWSEEAGESMIALAISKNRPLSGLYQDNFQVVRIVMDHILTAHVPQQEEMFLRMFRWLAQYMEEHPGYYNLRLPVHVIDAIRAVNQTFPGAIFCGGTVELLHYGEPVHPANELKIFLADADYIHAHQKRLTEISYESFREYQGQYHISPVTDHLAGHVYENWLNSSFTDYKDNVVVAELEGKPIGFVLMGESDTSVDIALGAVSAEARGHSGYMMMSAWVLDYAWKKNKLATASTQLDNFFAQRAWEKIGMQPFYSIYNFHLDRRK